MQQIRNRLPFAFVGRRISCRCASIDWNGYVAFAWNVGIPIHLYGFRNRRPLETDHGTRFTPSLRASQNAVLDGIGLRPFDKRFNMIDSMDKFGEKGEGFTRDAADPPKTDPESKKRRPNRFHLVF